MLIRRAPGSAPLRTLLAVIILCSATADLLAQSILRPLILSDQAALNSGILDGRADGLYNDFVAPMISSNGLVAFEAGVSYFPDDNNSQTPESRAGIWVMGAATGTQRLVMLSGMPAPGTTGNFTSGFSEVRIDSLGNVMFDASSPVSYYHATPTGELKQVALQSQFIPGAPGKTFGDIRLGTGHINNGHMVVNEPVVQGGTAALRWDGFFLTSIIVPDMPVPGEPDGTLFTTASALVNSSGDNLIFTATRTGAVTTPAYWRSTDGALSPLVKVGDLMPGFPFFDPTFSTLHSADINDAGQVAFSGSGSDGPFSFAALYRTSESGFDLVASRNDSAPNPVGPTNFINFTNVAINGEGNIAFQADTGFNGLWIARPNEAGDDFGFTNVAIATQSLLDPLLPANATFSNIVNAFSAFNFNALDQLAFMAKLAGTGINSTNDDSLWFYDPVDGLKLIARENTPFLLGNGDSKIIQTIEFTANRSGGQDGRPTALNDQGMLVFSLMFTDTSDGIFLYGPPPTGDDFYWRGDDAIDDNWHTLLAGDTNWEDDLDNIHATPPGQSGDEAVFIETPADITIDQQDVNIGSLTAADTNLTLRRRLQLNATSSLHSITLDRPQSELHLNTDLTLLGPGSIWEDGTINADTASILAGDAKLLVATGGQLDVKTNSEGLGSRTLAAPLFIQGRVIQHDGTWTLDEAININGGVLEVRDGSLFGAAFVNNAGRLEKTTADTFEILVPFNNNNSVIVVEEGTLRFTRNGLHSGGRYEILEGATLEFDLGATGEINVTADLFVGGELSTENLPTGVMRILSGNYLAADGVTVTFALHSEGLKLEGGTLGGPGLIHNSRIMRWTGGTIETSGDGSFKNTDRVDLAEFNDQTVKLIGKFVNEADVNQGSDGGLGGQFILDGADIQNSGQWDLFGGTFAPTGAPSTFNNTGGTLNVYDNTEINIPVNNSDGGEIRSHDDSFLLLSTPSQHTGSGAFVLVDGRITITADQTFNGDHEIRGTGTFFMHDADLDIQSGQLKYAAIAPDPSEATFLTVSVSGDGTFLIDAPTELNNITVAGGHIRNETSELHFANETLINDEGDIKNADTMLLDNLVKLDSGGKLINLSTGLLKLHTTGPHDTEIFTITSIDAADNSKFVNEGGQIELDGTNANSWRMLTPVELIGGSVKTTAAAFTFERKLDVTSPVTFQADAEGGFFFLPADATPATDVTLAAGTRFEGNGFLVLQNADMLISGGDVVVELTGTPRFSVSNSTITADNGRLINRSDAIFTSVTVGYIRNEVGLADPSQQLLFKGTNNILTNTIENAGRMFIGGSPTLHSTIDLTNEAGASATIENALSVQFGSKVTNLGDLRWEKGQTETDARNLVFDNQGTLDLGPAAQLKLEASRVEQITAEGAIVSTLALTGGTWTFQPGSLLTITNNNTEILQLTRSQADITLIGNGGIHNLAVDFHNQGDLKLLQGTHLSLSGQFENDGFLFIDPSSSLTADEIDNDGTAAILGSLNGDITLTSSSEFSGTGTVNGNVITAGATLPGQSPGLLTVDGDFTQESSASFIIEIAGNTPGTDYDQLLVIGLASIDGLLEISFLDDFLPAPSDTFTILSADTLTGTFDNAPPDTFLLPDLGSFDIQYTDSAVILTNFHAIPEPASLSLLIFAACGFVMLPNRINSTPRHPPM